MVSSTESAIRSRDTSEDFIPWWPIAMPSVTVMVVNSRGVPPASFTPFFTDCAWRDERDVAGRGLVPAGGDADERLVDLVLGQPHRVVVAAMRRAAGSHRHVARRHARLVPAPGQHRCVLSWSGRAIIAPSGRSLNRSNVSVGRLGMRQLGAGSAHERLKVSAVKRRFAVIVALRVGTSYWPRSERTAGMGRIELFGAASSNGRNG